VKNIIKNKSNTPTSKAAKQNHLTKDDIFLPQTAQYSIYEGT